MTPLTRCMRTLPRLQSPFISLQASFRLLQTATFTSPPPPPPPATTQRAQPQHGQQQPPRVSCLRRPRKAALTLTKPAVERLRALSLGPEPKFIRVGVKNRGCSGLSYHLEYVDAPGKFDEHVDQDGVKVLVDSKALFSVIGSEMDFVSEKLREGFVFKNPNIKEQCGCGESFSIG